MAKPNVRRRAAGFTLVELLVATAVAAVIVVLVTEAIVALDRDQTLRRKVSALQGGARQALEWLEADLRHAALGAGSGVIWMPSGGTRIARPAVQIFRSVPGGGALDVKPGTDALLVVELFDASTRANVKGDVTPANFWTDASKTVATIPVTTVAQFTAGQTLLIGDLVDACWGAIATDGVDATNVKLTLASAVNVLPGRQVQKLASGSLVRRARARLYYVAANDDLVRLELSAPRAPAAGEVLTREVLGRGFEDMRVECQTDDQLGGFGACPAAMDTSETVSTESATAFGAFAAGQGPVFQADPTRTVNIPLLRTVSVDVAVRSAPSAFSRTGEVDANQGDAPVQLPDRAAALGVGQGANATASYVRRAYRTTAAIRNVSLGAL